MNEQSTKARADCAMFRGTHRVKGRKRIIDQTNSGLDFLRYGRTVIDGEAVEADTGFWLCQSVRSTGTLVLPTITAPAAFSRRTSSLSRGAM